MDSVLEIGIQKCFSGSEFLQRIVHREFLKSKHFVGQPKLNTLSFLAIKSIMHKELMKDETDVYSEYLYKLIFKEPLQGLNQFYKNKPIWEAEQPSESEPISEPIRRALISDQHTNEPDDRSAESILTAVFDKVKYLFQNLFWKDATADQLVLIETDEPIVFDQPSGSECLSSESHSDWDEICKSEPIWRALYPEELSIEWEEIHHRKTQIRQLRFNGPIVFAILDQYLPRFDHNSMDIILTRNTVQICFEEQYFAEIPQKDGSEFDTFWAEKFMKLMLSKDAEEIYLAMIGEGMFDHDYMRDFIHNTIIDELPRVILPEGYEKYMSKQRPMYFKIEESGDGDDNYVVVFIGLGEYNQSFDKRFWVYLAEY